MINLTSQLLSKSFSQRIKWVKAIIFILFAVIVARSFYLQVINRPFLQGLADRQHNQRMSIKKRRGTIYDANGNILAVSLPMDSIFAVPAEIKSAREAALQLSEALEKDGGSIFKKLTAGVSFTWLERNAKPSVSEKIKQLNIKGVHRLTEYQRYYPLGHHASQLLGFSGLDSKGLEGLEVAYDKHLRDGSQQEHFLSGIYDAPEIRRFSGGSIQLSIDYKIQHFTESELKKALEGSKALKAIAIVMESQTGKILAMASAPDFDPNNFGRYNNRTYFNHAAGFVYEPGSTFKVITVASALENGIISDDSIYYCEEGAYQIQDRVIHDVGKYGWLPISEIIQKSSNICAAKIGTSIPRPKFYKKMRDFGFGERTGINLPGESRGRLHDFKKWSDIDVATMSYGHSISATPIQIITAINSIATRGELISPSVIKSIYGPNGKPIDVPSQKRSRVITTKTADMVKQYMVSVTQKGGTGYIARMKGVTVAGKTGTSKKIDKNGQYTSKKYVSSFVGFFPAEAPKLTVLVILDEPRKTYLRTRSATPVFREVATQAYRVYQQDYLASPNNRFNFRKVPTTSIFAETNETRLPSSNLSVVRLLKGKTMKEVLKLAGQRHIRVDIQGSGVVKEVIPDKNRPNHYYVIFNQ